MALWAAATSSVNNINNYLNLNNQIQAFVELTRPHNAAKWVLSFCIGFFFAQKIPVTADFFVGLVVVLLVHVIITVQNDIEDLAIDKVNSPQKPLSRLAVSVPQAKTMLSVLVLIIALLALVHLPRHFFFVALMLFLAWAYNKLPLQLSRRPILSLTSLGFLYSVVPLGYGYFLANSRMTASFRVMLASWYVLRISVSILKDYKDIHGDELGGKKTFVIVFGKKITAAISNIFALGAYGVILFYSWRLKGYSWPFIIPVIFAAISVLLRFKLLGCTDNAKLSRQFQRILVGQNYFDLGYLLWLVI